jgi:magnesium-transporting ATPase (P-type)
MHVPLLPHLCYMPRLLLLLLLLIIIIIFTRVAQQLMASHKVNKNNNNNSNSRVKQSISRCTVVRGCTQNWLRRSAVWFGNPPIHETRGKTTKFVLALLSCQLRVLIPTYMGSSTLYLESAIVRRAWWKQIDQEWTSSCVLMFFELGKNIKTSHWLGGWGGFRNLWPSRGLKHNSTI